MRSETRIEYQTYVACSLTQLHVYTILYWRGTGGWEPGRIEVGGVREAGREKRISKVPGTGKEEGKFCNIV